MIADVLHRLSFAVRFRNHFSGRAVPDELPVRLAGSYGRPARRPDGGGARQADGSYRFIDAAPGPQRILWRDPFVRSQAGWTRWDPADPELMLPLADPGQVVEVELWPAADATAPAGATGVRGKLAGAGAGGLEVRIAPQGQPFDRITRTDQAGEFLFLPSGALPPDTTGHIALTIEARLPGGAVRPVAGGRFQPPAAGPGFAGPGFTERDRLKMKRILRW